MRYARTALLAILLLTCACSKESPLNVLLVTFDTTRADRIGCYGYSEPSSPNIDRLALEGTLFTQVFCTNPITLPSHASILTGTYPLLHGVRDNSTFVVPEDVTTLAEIFEEEGYETAAVIGSFVLDSRFNLDQGFAYYNDRLAEGWSKDEMAVRAMNAFGFAERKANLVSLAALEWLKRPRSKPFFMWLHYFDPHQPINPPEPHHSRFSEPYAAEIAYADEQLGQVLTELRRQNEYDRTLIVVTSDHGEGLLDHSEASHSLLIFDSTMQVPLVYRMPGAPADLRLDQLTSTVDIMPTILDLLGFEIPVDVQGQSRAALVMGQEGPGSRAVYGESLVGSLQCGWGALRSLRTTSEKLIHGPDVRYYRVDTDPGEIYNLAASEPEAVERLTRELDARMDLWGASESGESRTLPDEETMRKLASLGYITGGSSATQEIDDELTGVEGKDDPHQTMWLFDLMALSTESLRTGNPFQGIEGLEEVVRNDPDNIAALNYLAKAYLIESRRPELAKEYFERTLAINPNQEEAHHLMCRILRAEGDLEGARRHAESILAFQPHSVPAHFELAGISTSEGNTAQAREYLVKLLEIDESNWGALLELGLSYGRVDEHEEAGTYFKRALDLEPNHPAVLYNVGIWHLQRENIEEAITSLSQAVKNDHPTNADAYYVLGRLLYDQNETARARDALLKARELVQQADRRQVIENILRSIDES
jgi:arylsulfatase A-like enzyme/Tfp pilus assembly protein PilF